MKIDDTSWGKVASWYDQLVGDPDSYQAKVITPNLLRVLSIKKREKFLDLGCGQGFFARLASKEGAEVTGVDIAAELVQIAKKSAGKNEKYFVSSADQLGFLQDKIFDCAAIVLALQNIKNLSGALAEVSRVLKPGGRLAVVLNHPTFRVPGKSAWGFDQARGLQYRRVDSYLSEFSKEIDMHPGKDLPRPKKYTYSFHRPLQVYFKEFVKNGFVVTRLEEWVSHKKSDSGPKAAAENQARKEFPLFMCLELRKIKF